MVLKDLLVFLDRLDTMGPEALLVFLDRLDTMVLLVVLGLVDCHCVPTRNQKSQQLHLVLMLLQKSQQLKQM